MGVMKNYTLLGFLLLAMASCTSRTTISCCVFTETVESSQRMTITGIAGEYHKGSYRHVYVEEDSSIYYLTGRRYWKKRVLGKKVKVTGTMNHITVEPPDDGVWQYISELDLFVRYRYKVVK